MKVKIYSMYLLFLLLVTAVLPSFPVFSVISKAFPTKTSKTTAVALFLMTGLSCGGLYIGYQIHEELRRENRGLRGDYDKWAKTDNGVTITNLRAQLAFTKNIHDQNEHDYALGRGPAHRDNQVLNAHFTMLSGGADGIPGVRPELINNDQIKFCIQDGNHQPLLDVGEFQYPTTETDEDGNTVIETYPLAPRLINFIAQSENQLSEIIKHIRNSSGGDSTDI